MFDTNQATAATAATPLAVYVQECEHNEIRNIYKHRTSRENFGYEKTKYSLPTTVINL